MFMPTDAAAPGMRQLAADLRGKGAALFVDRAGRARAGRLPALPPDHPETDAVCLIQSFYAMLVARRRAARHRRRPAAAPAEGHAHTMSAPRSPRGRRRHMSSTARSVHRDHAVVIEGARIVGRDPRGATCRTAIAGPRRCPRAPGSRPGFIDVQVNGGGDVLFNDAPTRGGHRRHRRGASPLRHHGARCRR